MFYKFKSVSLPGKKILDRTWIEIYSGLQKTDMTLSLSINDSGSFDQNTYQR